MKSYILSVSVVVFTVLSASGLDWATVVAATEWKPHVVRQLNGATTAIQIPAKLQIVTERMNRWMAVPYLGYIPEKDRLLLVALDYPHQTVLWSSDDRGVTWTAPSPIHVDGQAQPVGTISRFTYFGDGKMMMNEMTHKKRRWLSADCGTTWSKAPAGGRTPYGGWDPAFVDRDSVTGGVTRVVETGYESVAETSSPEHHQRANLRFSADEGHTWSDVTWIPQWDHVSEVALVRARNGDLIGACRTDITAKTVAKFPGPLIDHYEGMGISISKDNGNTWSNVNKLYDWGRHHPSILLMPDGGIVMTYVVRKGYVDTPDGYPQFGIEAVVSHDDGQSWDFDHRYLLHTWVGNQKGPNGWVAGSQQTSTVLLPEGDILTAFGTGYRQNAGTPRDVGLVLWRLGDQPLNDDRTIRDAPFDSDLRNVVDPATGKHGSAPGVK